MKIVYYNSCWPTNIGNGFIDYGSIHMIKKAVPTAEVYCASEMAKWIFKANRQNMSQAIDLTELMEVDCIVLSGMTLCDEFIEVEGPVLQKLSERGVGIIFNGCGGEQYTHQEVDNFKNFFDSIKVTGFISRDEVSYKNFKDCSPRSCSGIDCGLFLSEAFEAAPLIIKDYVVYAFDGMGEPEIEAHGKEIFRTHHACSEILPSALTEDLKRKEPIFLIGKKWPFLRRFRGDLSASLFKYDNILISDIPDDYLHLYAHADAVYSDRVHACIAALSFGNFARLYSKTLRAYLFDRMGVGSIKDELVCLDQKNFKVEKERHVSFLRSILESK